MKALIAAGADPSLKDNAVLGMALRSGKDDIVRCLTSPERGEKRIDPDKTTALMRAIEKGNIGTVKLLLEVGATPNVKTHNGTGYTALHWAAFFGKVKVIELLTSDERGDKKSDHTIRDNSGKTPLDVALEQNQTAAAAMLETLNKQPSTNVIPLPANKTKKPASTYNRR